jgi:hypothetical protein
MEISNLNEEGNINVTISINGLNGLNELINKFNEFINKILPEPQNKEKYYTRKEASEILNVSKSTLSRWQTEKYLLPVSVGGSKLYKKSDIDNLYKPLTDIGYSLPSM